MKAFLQRGCELQCGGRATWKPLLPVQEMQSFPGIGIFSVPSPALLSTRETVHAIPEGRESRRVACFILTYGGGPLFLPHTLDKVPKPSHWDHSALCAGALQWSLSGLADCGGLHHASGS